MTELTELYERFKNKLEAVSGECYRTKTSKEAGKLVCEVLQGKGVRTVALLNSSLSQEGNFIEQLKGAGISVSTDRFREVTPDAQAGITLVSYAIAELGTLVQADADANVNQRLCSTLVPIHVALVTTNNLIPTLMETMATIHRLPQIPGFVGFITGPSRTSDIERVLTIGVHGPKQLVVIFVDEVVEGVA
ncbi:MAG: lactate utilization protein [Bacillota bacterium]|nr:lactate utilization protein [Bacillota bacterium]MDP4158433.1 lactate utilization protein [Bacillota bacterium]